MKVLISLKNLGKTFVGDEILTKALSGINLDIKKGEYIALSGPSGCGKSTLLSILGILDTASSGNYYLNDIEVTSLSENDRAKIRNKQIGFVFQSFNLISHLKIDENVALPMTYDPSRMKAEMRERIEWALEKVQMSHRIRHYPSQLSGGEQQRAAIARALVNDPAILLADEPTGNLDSKNAAATYELFQQLHDEGTTICMVTHDPNAANYASRKIDMLDGKIIAENNTNSDQKNIA